ncbi:MAG: ASCH domain-containing protein [Azospirillaceae bacterium]
MTAAGWTPEGAPDVVTRALIVRAPWIDLILDGTKTWEMRSRRTAVRGRIALIRAGGGRIEGLARLVDCLAPLDREAFESAGCRHAIPPDTREVALASGWTTPWVLDSVRRLSRPVSFPVPKGAVVWVRLDRATAAAVERRTAGA